MQTLNDLNLYISFYITFVIFLRLEELTWNTWDSIISSSIQVSRKSVKFMSNEIIIHIPKSKINQIEEDINISLSFINNVFCLVQTLHRLFKKYSKNDSNSLFMRVIDSFNKKWFTENITIIIQKAEISNVFKYSDHSFHRDAVNTIIIFWLY